jgi:hypothetical protein
MRASSLAAALTLLFTAAASAAEPRWGLTFKSDPGCLGAAALAEAIEKRLSRPLFGAQPDLRIEGWLRADGPRRWRARLTLVDAEGTVKGSREVTQEGASCRAIDGSLTLVAAVMIDPASAMRAPSPPPAADPPDEAPHGTVEPPPPPSSEGPALIIPKLPPRELWPGYLLVEGDQLSQDGRWMSRGTFYRVVGRPDLESWHARRVTTKSLSYVLGTAGLTAGGVLMLMQAANVSCVRFEGNPLANGRCLETRPWPLISGLVSAGVGLALVIFGAVLRAAPTTPREDAELAESYNSRLKPPALPVTASR